MVGAILSTISAACGGVALLGVLLNSGIIEQWGESMQQGQLERRVNSVVTDIAHATEEQHEQTGEWATSYKDLEGVEVDDDGEVRDVVVLAYRRGDDVCVDGSQLGYTASYADGEVSTAGCADRGYKLTLNAATAAEDKVVEQDALAAATKEVSRRAQETASTASLGEPRGLSYVSFIDIEVCALFAGNRGHLPDRAHREALVLTLTDPVALSDLEFKNALYTMTRDLDLQEEGIYSFWQNYLGAEFACWDGGFVDVAGPPEFPKTWTTPLSAADQAGGSRTIEEWGAFPEAEHEAFLARQDARDDQQRRELEAILAAGYGSGT